MEGALAGAGNIILIGYRGSGKSTVGTILAEKLGRPHIDIDKLVQDKLNKSIAEIFKEQGQAFFRTAEGQTIAELHSTKNSVISVGGGAVCAPANRQILSKLGFIVWLQASAEDLHRRINADDGSAMTRPPLTTENQLSEIRKLLAERTPDYEALADTRIDTTNLPPTAIADLILTHVQPQAGS